MEPARNVEENKIGAPTLFFSLSSPKEERAGGEPMFFRIKSPRPGPLPARAGRGSRDSVKMHPGWAGSDRFGLCIKLLLLRSGRTALACLAPFVQVGFNLFHCRFIQFVEEHENEQRNHAD